MASQRVPLSPHLRTRLTSEPAATGPAKHWLLANPAATGPANDTGSVVTDTTVGQVATDGTLSLVFQVDAMTLQLGFRLLL